MGEVVQFGSWHRRPFDHGSAHTARAVIVEAPDSSDRDYPDDCPHSLLARAGFSPTKVRVENELRIIRYSHQDGPTVELYSNADHTPVSFDAQRSGKGPALVRFLGTPSIRLCSALQVALITLFDPELTAI